jgi:hypothetical protein
MKWITREDAKVERTACLWLIRKFMDKVAEFLYVPADIAHRSPVTEQMIRPIGAIQGPGFFVLTAFAPICYK